MSYFLLLVVIMLVRALSAGVLFARLGKDVNFSQAMRLTVLSSALNKLFITASGFIAASYYAKAKGLDPMRAMVIFLLLESMN